jgi:hypothetical protein
MVNERIDCYKVIEGRCKKEEIGNVDTFNKHDTGMYHIILKIISFGKSVIIL